jgi:hypothetical protein
MVSRSVDDLLWSTMKQELFPTTTTYEHLMMACRFYRIDHDRRSIALHRVMHEVWDLMQWPDSERRFAPLSQGEDANNLSATFHNSGDDTTTCAIEVRVPGVAHPVVISCRLTLTSEEATVMTIHVGDWKNNNLSRTDTKRRLEALQGAADQIIDTAIYEAKTPRGRRR